MKTITEYRPMIFSQLAARTEERLLRRRRVREDIVFSAAYATFGLWLAIDTGLVPCDCEFWAMFLPFFVAGEIAGLIRRAT
jgi:hypothetical protein